MNLLKIALPAIAALTLGANIAVADQHGNEFVHSRANNGQVYVMYQDHMSLYYSDNDKRNVSNCYGECAEKWIPATLPAKTKLGKSYTLFKRKDGSMQIAFRGKPLYLWSEDWQIGDTNGDGIDGVWHLARP